MTEFSRIRQCNENHTSFWVLKLVIAFVNVNGREPVLNPGPLSRRPFHYTTMCKVQYACNLSMIMCPCSSHGDSQFVVVFIGQVISYLYSSFAISKCTKCNKNVLSIKLACGIEIINLFSKLDQNHEICVIGLHQLKSFKIL